MTIKIELYYWPNANAGLGHVAVTISDNSPSIVDIDHTVVKPQEFDFDSAFTNKTKPTYLSAGGFEPLEISLQIYGREFIVFNFILDHDYESCIKIIDIPSLRILPYSLFSNNCAHVVVAVLNRLGLNEFKSCYLLRPIEVSKQVTEYSIAYYTKLIKSTANLECIVNKVKLQYYQILKKEIAPFLDFTFSIEMNQLIQFMAAINSYNFSENNPNAKVYFISLCDMYQAKLPSLQPSLFKLKTEALKT